jgi:pimeloyl-ACP methyl ester carboxylesterase
VFSGTARMTLEVDWLTLEPKEDPTPGLACRPVLLLHGWNAGGGEMGPGTAWFDGLGKLDIPCHAVDLTSRGSIYQNAALLETAVSDLKKRFGVQRVNVLGFSKGGLDAREYLRTHDDIEILVMLATPNEGSFLVNWAVVPLWWTASVPMELSPASMMIFNEFDEKNDKTAYITIGAEYDSIFAQLAAELNGPNDEVVAVSSVHSVPYASPMITHPTFITDPVSQSGSCQNLSNHSCLRYNDGIFAKDVWALEARS